MEFFAKSIMVFLMLLNSGFGCSPTEEPDFIGLWDCRGGWAVNIREDKTATTLLYEGSITFASHGKYEFMRDDNEKQLLVKFTGDISDLGIQKVNVIRSIDGNSPRHLEADSKSFFDLDCIELTEADWKVLEKKVNRGR